jgi:hypothetical protein
MIVPKGGHMIYPWGRESPSLRIARLEKRLFSAQAGSEKVSLHLSRTAAQRQLEEVREYQAERRQAKRASGISTVQTALTPTTIYALLDPITKDIRYVGKTVQKLSVRLGAHISATRMAPLRNKRRLHVQLWIAPLLEANLKPIIVELELVPAGQNWVHAEQNWIAKCRSQGLRLTNETDGGEGVLGHRHSAATCARLSETKKQFMGTPEQRMLASNRMWSRKLTNEDALQIVQRYVFAKGQLKQEDLALEYQVRQSAISNLFHRRTFKHVISLELGQRAAKISRLQTSKVNSSDVVRCLERYVDSCGRESLAKLGAEIGLGSRSLHDAVHGFTHVGVIPAGLRREAQFVASNLARQGPSKRRAMTDEDAEWIRKNPESLSLNRRAIQLGVSKKAVQNVLKGLTYRRSESARLLRQYRTDGDLL